VILIGSGKGFSGGADIREFGTPKSYAEPDLRRCCAVEDCASR
jgi:3-hydroxyacyl-CoA dehydrogenase